MEQEEYWPSEKPGAKFDWLEFIIDPEYEEDEYPTRVRVNLSFMLSRWACMFGKCPGILITGAMSDVACCQIGVHINKHEFKRLSGYVEQMTAEDADNIEEIRKDMGWYYRVMDPKDREDGFLYHTRVKDGGCIFANRHDGPTGKPGCAFHVLADRLGLHHSETKPEICWQVPFAVSEEYDEDEGITTITVDGTTAGVWGDKFIGDLKSIGWWCLDTPDAYSGDQMVYRSAEVELRKLMGDRVYEAMRDHLDRIVENGGRRFPMPGELENKGRWMIPLMVRQRIVQWQEAGKKEELERSERFVTENPECAP